MTLLVILVGLVAVGGLAALLMVAAGNRENKLEQAWMGAAERLGYKAKFDSGLGTFSLDVELPEGRLRLTATSEVQVRAGAYGAGNRAVTTVRFTGRLPPIQIKARSLPFGSNEVRTGEDRFDKAVVVHGRPEVVYAVVSGSVRSALTQLISSRVHGFQVDNDTITWRSSNFPEHADDMRDLIRSARSVIKPIAERCDLSPEDALLETLKSDRSVDMRKGALEAIAIAYPDRLSDALAIADKDPVELVRLRAAGIAGGGVEGGLSIADASAGGLSTAGSAGALSRVKEDSDDEASDGARD